jgi:hypothetical protein
VVTDHAEYREWIRGNNKDAGLVLEEYRRGPLFETKYEKKWVAMGQSEFYHLCFRKIQHVPVQVEEDLRLQTRRLRHVHLDRIPLFSETGEITVRAEEIVKDQSGRVALVRFVVAEDGYVQHLWIELREGNGSWKIAPSRGSMFLPTRGVQLAVDLLYKRLCAAEDQGILSPS